MSKAIDDVLAKALRLDPQARAELASELLASLEGPSSPPIGSLRGAASLRRESIPLSRRSVPLLKKARYVDGYRIELSYDDGTEGIVDLEDQLWGEAFEPLKKVAFFKSFRVDRGFSTLVWPNDTDMAPELLYERASTSRAPRARQRKTRNGSTRR